MFYRFPVNDFVESESFEEAKNKILKQIETHIEDEDNWNDCDCVGFQHHHRCKENPWNKGEYTF